MTLCNCLKKCFVGKRSFKKYFNKESFKNSLKDYSNFEYHAKIKTDADIDELLTSFEDNIKRNRKSLIWLQQEYSVLEKMLERSVARTENISSKAQNLLTVLIAVIPILVPIGGYYLADINKMNALIFFLLIALCIIFIYDLYKLLLLVTPSEKYENQNLFKELNDQSTELEFYQLKVAHTIVSLNLRDCQNQDDGDAFQCVCMIASVIPIIIIAILLIHIYPIIKAALTDYLCCCSCSSP